MRRPELPPGATPVTGSHVCLSKAHVIHAGTSGATYPPGSYTASRTGEDYQGKDGRGTRTARVSVERSTLG